MNLNDIAKTVENEALRNRAKADLGGTFASEFRPIEIRLSLAAAIIRNLGEQEVSNNENRTKRVHISRCRRRKHNAPRS